MLNKKRTKSSRKRGSQTHGRGFMKKARGSGHRGGFGMAGTGKRADHKKSLITNMDEKYFGSGGGLKPKPYKFDVVNVGELEKLAKGKKELNLEKYKILGKGSISTALKIKVGAASKTAIEKIEGAGGSVIVKVKKEVVKKVKEEKKEEKS